MPLTIRNAQNNADLQAIATLFNTPVNGQTIVQELAADWGTVTPMTVAVWGPRLNSPTDKVRMGFQPANTLRGAAWWRLINGVWDLSLVGIDKSLTAQQRQDGFHDFMLNEANLVPGTTAYSGLAIVGSSIYNYLTSRLPAERVTLYDTTTPTGKQLAKIQTTAAETIALL